MAPTSIAVNEDLFHCILCTASPPEALVQDRFQGHSVAPFPFPPRPPAPHLTTLMASASSCPSDLAPDATHPLQATEIMQIQAVFPLFPPRLPKEALQQPCTGAVSSSSWKKRENHSPSFPPPLTLPHYCSQGFQLVDIRAYQLLAELLQNLGVGLQPCAGAGGNTEGFNSAPGSPRVKSNLHC